MKIISAAFITSAVNKAGWPKEELPEVAFAGRSNVGKSSLMNSLLNRKGLVKTGKEPGKTRMVNFFLINGRWHFTDLPGYGFATGDKREVAGWKPMIEQYLMERKGLRALVHIVDIRREPDGMEQMMALFARRAGREHILVANKCDKLSNSACAKNARAIEKILGVKPLLCSAHTGKGGDTVWKELRRVLSHGAPEGPAGE